MPNRNLFVMAFCLLPLYAQAEVLDKLPQAQDMWLHAALGIAFAGIALRIHWGLFALALIYPTLWFVGLFMDLYSFDLGPAIVAEAGRSYLINAHAAAIVWLLGSVGLAVWKKIGNLKKRTASSGGS